MDYLCRRSVNKRHPGVSIIWSDGHTTTISSEEAFRRQYEFYTDDGSEWRMRIGDAEFAWHGNCWMQL